MASAVRLSTPNQERLLSYGVDLQMLVNATKNRQTDSILSGKISKGVLYIQRKHVFTQEYVAENKGDKDKTLLIEHPVRPDWKLIEPAKADETTEALYRFTRSGEAVTASVRPVEPTIIDPRRRVSQR